MRIHLQRKHVSLDIGPGPGRQQTDFTLSKGGAFTSGASPTSTENPLNRTFAISQHTTVFRYQTHIEHRDCSVNDDITISFYLFDTAKIVYTSSADHRPSHPESDSFCSLFNFTTATFPGAHNQPIRLLLRAQARSCVFLISFFFSLCVGVTVLGTNCVFFLFTAACYGRFCVLLRLHFYLVLHLQPATCTL